MPKLKKFLNIKIDLSKKVFIPEVETKYWTKKAIKEIQNFSKKNPSSKIKILDIFAGSGFIGISVLKNVKNSFVDFVDIDDNAISQIKINLKLNKISSKRYKVIKSDIFSNLPKKKYNFILANPPYVALKNIKEVQRSVLEKDPFISLFSGKDGLNHIRIFLRDLKKFLKKDGICFMEFDPRQAKEISKILSSQDLNFEIKKDQFHLDRYVIIKNNKK